MLRRVCSLGEGEGGSSHGAVLRPVFPLIRTGVRWGPVAGSPVRLGQRRDIACSAHVLAPPTWVETPFQNNGRTVAFPALAPSLRTMTWRGSHGGGPRHPNWDQSQQVGGSLPDACYLHAVCVVQERRLLHPEVVGDQGVEAIGEIQDLGVAAALGHCLQGRGGRKCRLRRSSEASALGRAFSFGSGCHSGVPRGPRVCTGRCPRGHGPARVRLPRSGSSPPSRCTAQHVIRFPQTISSV